jgi:hypothetical protein
MVVAIFIGVRTGIAKSSFKWIQCEWKEAKRSQDEEGAMIGPVIY